MKLIYCLSLILASSVALAQSSDSLSVVNFFGQDYAVQGDQALTQFELKQIVKSNPEAFASFKKVRRLNYLAFTLDVLGAVSLFAGLVSESSGQLIAGSVGAGVLIGTAIAIRTGPKNRHMRETVRLYNASSVKR